MGKKKDTGKKKERNRDGYSVPNTCAIVLVLFLCGIFIYESLNSVSIYDPTGTIVSGIVVGAVLLSLLASVLLILSFIYASPSMKAFFIPGLLFLFYTLLMTFDSWGLSANYLLACLCFSLIGCLYSRFRVAMVYIIIQYAVIALLITGGTEIIGPGVALVRVWFSWFISLFGAVTLLILTRTATVILGRAASDQNSFRTLLQTTPSNIAMVDELNRVVYVSKSLSELTGIEDTQLTIGRPFIDLFPGRELKLLVHKMLKNKSMWADDWEFTLNGQKKYFKVISTTLTGTANNALINLRDMTDLAERNEISVMRDSLQIGLFFMDRNYIIQSQYSRFLEDLLSETDLFGKRFPDLLARSVSASELTSVQDYFDMIFSGSFEKSMLIEINPLNELHYVSITEGIKKVFHCDFTTIERERGQTYALVTIYDITAKVELQQRLAERESRRQEEMQSIFELVQVDHDVFNDFQEDANEKFIQINDILKDTNIQVHEALVEVYQLVHAIKSNAVILGLNIFGNKAHNLESLIKKLREQEGEVSFDDRLNLTIEIEKLSEEKESFRATIEKIQVFNKNVSQVRNQGEYVLIESLSRAATKTAMDLGKKVQFVVEEIDTEAIEHGPTRIMKDVLMQLVRNAVVHGVEVPEERTAKGKEETGIVRLSIKVEGGKIRAKLEDDGKGLDYKKIRERAIELNLVPKEEDNKDVLIKVIFSPEFSTAESEGIHAGRGMGLNLVRDRMRDVHGSIGLRSVPDKGTVFDISIPLKKAE
ncbi:MAG: PAS domain S-box protein [Treponema sp.]|jgi:two-component system chemotaxis sensor kinase CheA|nr:PAS domain S-box protein [Treponema sp.]